VSDGEQGVSWDILDESATLSLTPQEDGGLFLEVDDEDGDRIWAEQRERNFWDSRTTKGEIANNLAEQLPQTKAEVKAELQQVWVDLSENSSEYEQALLNPSVEQLIQQTERVEVHGGTETEIDVYVTAKPHGGEPDTRKLTFSNSEWMRADGDRKTPPVAIKYNNVFYRPLDINWEQWREDIRPAWVEMQEVITDDHQTVAERIAMSAVRKLKSRLDVHADQSPIVNDTWNGHWDDSGDETTIWVPGDTMLEILDENGRDQDYLGAVSRAAQQQGFTSDGRKQTSIDGNPINLYPFPAEVLGIQEIDVIGLESDDDDGDGEGETGGDDGGGGDGGGDTPDSPGAASDVERPESAGPASAGSGRTGEIVAETVKAMDNNGAGVDEDVLVAEVSERRDMPSDDAASAVERGVVDGKLYRPTDSEGTIALRPGGGEPAGRDELPFEAEGVPEP
jgi:hypothetical protein